MKTTNSLRWVVLTLLLVLPVANFSQEGSPQMFWVHEDHVMPGMEDVHNKADMGLIAALKDAQMDTNWIATSTQDGVNRYLMAIESLSDIDKFSKEMDTKIDKGIMDDYKGTYSKHGDYVISLLPNLSYDPDGINQTPEGENFRLLTYYHPKPDMDEVFMTKAKEIKELFKSKSPNLHYRVYKSGFGIVDNYYMVAIAAKSADDYYSKIDTAGPVLGDDFEKLVNEIRKLCSEVRVEHAYIRPDLSMTAN